MTRVAGGIDEYSDDSDHHEARSSAAATNTPLRDHAKVAHSMGHWLEHSCDEAAARAREQLLQCPPGFAHGGAGGVWVMSGRALDKPFVWSSLPPAPSLSYVWGSGGCELQHAGGHLAIGPGQAMWIDGGHAHRGKGATGSDFVTLFVPAWTAKTASTRAGLTTLSRRAAEIVVRVAASVLRGQPDHAAITALQGLRSELCPHPQTHAVEPGTVRRAKAELDFRFSEGVDLTALSKVAGTSPWHLSRSFSERLGVPPMQYRKQLRLLAATWAMVQGASVTGAAAQAGFTDGPHFSRTFRAQYGISPAQWRASVAPALKGNQAAFD